MKTAILILLMAMALSITACNNTPEAENPGDTTVATAAPVESTPPSGHTIVSIGPAITEILVDIGLGQYLVGADTFSTLVAGVPAGIAEIDMFAIDVETILLLEPTHIFATDMIAFAGDPLALATEMGANVVYISTAATIADIMDNIVYIATQAGVTSVGEALVSSTMAEIEAIRAMASGATPTVYFEISPAPDLFTLGEGTFLHEMIEIVGGINPFGAYGGWVSIADEQVLYRNPDIIFTNVGWMGDPVAEILTRPGWDALDAVQNGRIYVINEDSTSRDNHRITIALREMAEAIHN